MIKFSDLSPEQVQEIIEEFAKRDGFKENKSFLFSIFPWIMGDDLFKRLPDYAIDKNAMGRIIEGMDEHQFYKYGEALYDATNCGMDWDNCHNDLKATAQQQFVAAAKALGLVKEEK